MGVLKSYFDNKGKIGEKLKKSIHGRNHILGKSPNDISMDSLKVESTNASFSVKRRRQVVKEDFDLLMLVGTGGFSEVYKAVSHLKKWEDKYAAKVISKRE